MPVVGNGRHCEPHRGRRQVGSTSRLIWGYVRVEALVRCSLAAGGLQHSSGSERGGCSAAYALSRVNRPDGRSQIRDVPPGHYKMEVWYDLASKAELASLGQEVEILSGSAVLPTITLHSSDAPQDHLDKYGQRYSADKTSHC